jgi:hypothetical protein
MAQGRPNEELGTGAKGLVIQQPTFDLYVPGADKNDLIARSIEEGTAF